ncbi:MAG: non-heme iron oxygenase ferredoxin subunit [Betaproteobacteria bacterium]|nr:MAG: non-heme iron oxygenase ferredoxin subunit [Betaproteobacteria bacterium]TMG77544.1 MAG: non-heme iron oxygenase ferredoxin subunit [Betaproteobacteria bacterium]
MAGFVKVAKTGDVALGSAKMVEAGGKKIAIFNVDGKYYAIDNTCTHRGGPLAEGALEGKEVTCPWHGAVFDVTTGEVLGPPAPKPVSRYEVRVSGKDIEVEV